MSTINPATATQPQSAAQTSAAAAEDSSTNGTMINSDFQTFLTMLTTQLQNQDPLNPMEASEFAVQLATFSSVEQQVKSNDLLESIQSQLGLQSMAQLAGWVGMEAKVQAPVYFDGAPVTMQASPHPAADRVELVVMNEAGTEVGRQQMTPSSDQFDWTGTQQNGTPYPAGNYSFRIESYSRSEMLSEGPVDVYAEIVEARANGGNTQLVLEGGTVLTADDIAALRKPPAPAPLADQIAP